MGIVSAILDGWTFEEMIDVLADMGFACVEVACWPKGKAERRYAGVSHIDVEDMSEERAAEILEYCAKKSVEISALAFYPNVLDADIAKREANITHLKKVIDASAILKVGMVTTFIGRDQTKTVEDNIELFKEIWPSIIKYAEGKDVKIAIENCPMLFGRDQWSGGQNLMTTPVIWRKLFGIIDSEYFGLNYDPSHFVWQQMDYLKPMYEFKDKIFHVHYKDIKVYQDKLDDCGIMAYPLEYMDPKIPGLGDVDWEAYVKTLREIGYDGYTCIEVEDRDYEESDERILESIRLSKQYLEGIMG